MPDTMTKEMTIPQLRRRLKPAEQMESFDFSPTGKGKHEFALVGADRQGEGGRMVFRYKRQEFTVKSNAYTKLAQIIGIPGAYVQKTPHKLMLPHMNYWLKNSRVKEIGFAVADNVIQLFSKTPLGGSPVAAVLAGVERMADGAKLQVHHVSNTVWNTGFSLVTDEDKTIAPSGGHNRANDIVRTGIAVEMSYAQLIPLTISAYTHTLVCTNGMISATSVFRMNARGDDHNDADWIDLALREAMAAGDAEIEKQKALREIKLTGHVNDALAGVYQEFGVPSAAQDLVTERIINEGADNLYDVMNQITWVASNHEDMIADPALARRMMRIGGQVAAHPELCTACHRVMN